MDLPHTSHGEHRRRPTYTCARVAFPYPRVAFQYREDCDRRSHHLLVLRNGTFKVDHVDAFNPDYPGNLLLHFIHDVNRVPLLPPHVLRASSFLKACS